VFGEVLTQVAHALGVGPQASGRRVGHELVWTPGAGERCSRKIKIKISNSNCNHRV
jgi:hypothetical protein